MANDEADNKILRPSPPYFWPDLRTILSDFKYSTLVPFQDCVDDSKAVAGLVSPIDHLGCEWLRTIIEENPDKTWNIILGVYGGCHTRNRDLLELHEVQNQGAGSVKFRVKAFETATAASTSLILVGQDNKIILAFGNSPNFGFRVREKHHLNLVVQPEAVLLNQWRSWFDWIWENSTALTNDTVQIPALVPATGTPEAAALWNQYLLTLDIASLSEIWTVDQTTGEIIPKDEAKKETKTITQEIGVPKSDPIAILVSEVIKKGSLITIDKASRVPPLDTPIPPAWFGDQSQIQRGLITRKTQIRISPFDDKTLRAIENKRKSVGTLVSKFSYPLADGVRWMPKSAVEPFFQEIQRANEEGKELLQTKISDGQLIPDIQKFLDDRRQQIEKDADAIFQQVTGKATSSKTHIDEILEKMEARLEKAFSANLLPQFTFSRIDFTLNEEGDWQSPWGQAFSLVWNSAEHCRKIFSDTFFMRGLKIGQTEYAEAMNVCDDWLVKKADEIRVDKIAADELETLSFIKDFDTPVRKKCEATLALIDGMGSEIAKKHLEIKTS